MYTEKDYKKDHEKLLTFSLNEQHRKCTVEQICAKRKALYDNIRNYSDRFIGKYVKFTDLCKTIVRYAYIQPHQTGSYFYKCVVLEPLSFSFTKKKYFRKRATYYIDPAGVYFEEITKDEWKSVLAEVIKEDTQSELIYTDSTIYNYITRFINKHPTKQEQVKTAAMDKARARYQKLVKECKALKEKRCEQLKTMVTEEIFDKVRKDGPTLGWFDMDCGFLNEQAKPMKKSTKKKMTKKK